MEISKPPRLLLRHGAALQKLPVGPIAEVTYTHGTWGSHLGHTGSLHPYLLVSIEKEKQTPTNPVKKPLTYKMSCLQNKKDNRGTEHVGIANLCLI